MARHLAELAARSFVAQWRSSPVSEPRSGARLDRAFRHTLVEQLSRGLWKCSGHGLDLTRRLKDFLGLCYSASAATSFATIWLDLAWPAGTAARPDGGRRNAFDGAGTAGPMR